MGGSSSRKMSVPTVLPKAKHTATVIFLHGLGDTGHGWLAGLEMIAQPHIKYICPNAPNKPVTLNFGMVMPSWFDIKSLSFDAEEDEAGIQESSKKLQSLIAQEESAGIARNRIIIGGFSQGGAVALYSALAEPKAPVGGVIGLSTFMPLHSKFPGALKANQNTPMLLGHGTTDPVVNFKFGEMTANLIKSLNPNLSFKTYPNLGHSSCDQEMQDVKKFIDEILPPV